MQIPGSARHKAMVKSKKVSLQEINNDNEQEFLQEVNIPQHEEEEEVVVPKKKKVKKTKKSSSK